jgi:regulator of sigma E protease
MKKLTPLHIIIGLLGITLIITIHEFGHWFFCKLFGVATPEFAIGLGPTLLEWIIAGTRFTIGLFPLGGYVDIEGMHSATIGFEQFSFALKPLWQKMFIIFGGIIANTVFGLATIGILSVRRTYFLKKRDVSELEHDPAFHNGGLIGPIGIISMVSRSTLYGLPFFAYLLALISINLAIFNLIPLPLLDGGQALITFIESTTGQVLSSSVYDALMTATLILLAFLFMLTIGKDMRRAFSPNE